jgi:fatty acid desaturase
LDNQEIMENDRLTFINPDPDTQSSELETDELKGLSYYNRELSKNLPQEVFRMTPERLGWAITYLGCNAFIMMVIMNWPIAWYSKIILGVIMGIFNGGMAFLAHEVLHGSIIKNQKMQDAFGFLGFLPFLVSPTYWRFWHNRLHHGNTQLLIRDPDAFPTQMVYKRSKFMQVMFPFTPGSGHKRSYSYFFFWFSFQAFLNQIYMRFGNKMWEKMDHKKVTMEFAAQCFLALCYVLFVGPENWFYLVVIPFMAQNYTVMSHISTNHNLNPLTKINDPLVNSLTVTNHPVMEFVNLNFGYHVEHHIFPRMSGKYTKVVHEQLKKQFPEKYLYMPKWKALRLLYSTPRIYKNKDELMNPETGATFKTIDSKSI